MTLDLDKLATLVGVLAEIDMEMSPTAWNKAYEDLIDPLIDAAPELILEARARKVQTVEYKMLEKRTDILAGKLVVEQMRVEELTTDLLKQKEARAILVGVSKATISKLWSQLAGCRLSEASTELLGGQHSGCRHNERMAAKTIEDLRAELATWKQPEGCEEYKSSKWQYLEMKKEIATLKVERDKSEAAYDRLGETLDMYWEQIESLKTERDQARAMVLQLVVSTYRQGWESGATEAETRQSATDELFNWGLDPAVNKEACKAALDQYQEVCLTQCRSNQELRESAIRELDESEKELADSEKASDAALGLLRELRDVMASTMQTCPRGALESAEMRAMKSWMQEIDERLAVLAPAAMDPAED